MSVTAAYLSTDQRHHAIKRLTALWAFTESGLGGIMHALQIPFTGLLVGGMALVMITLIAELSDGNYRHILKSAVIVLIVKAMVSPHTPPPAYIAVSFQALMGFTLFRLLKLNFVSILLLASVAMVESAIQKILVLTLFLGKSLWNALDEMMAMLAKQFGSSLTNGSYWIIGIYILIYLVGGIFIAILTWRTIKGFNTAPPVLQFDPGTIPVADPISPVRKKRFQRIIVLIMVMLVLSALLFVFAADVKTGWLAVLRTISWTISAILTWYLIIGPLFTKAIQKLLQKKQSKYADEVSGALAFLPVLRHLSVLAWQQSSTQPGYKRWYVFVVSLIHASLTYNEPPASAIK